MWFYYADLGNTKAGKALTFWERLAIKELIIVKNIKNAVVARNN